MSAVSVAWSHVPLRFDEALLFLLMSSSCVVGCVFLPSALGVSQWSAALAVCPPVALSCAGLRCVDNLDAMSVSVCLRWHDVTESVFVPQGRCASIGDTSVEATSLSKRRRALLHAPCGRSGVAEPAIGPAPRSTVEWPVEHRDSTHLIGRSRASYFVCVCTHRRQHAMLEDAVLVAAP